jgi:hypothetical protein
VFGVGSDSAGGAGFGFSTRVLAFGSGIVISGRSFGGATTRGFSSTFGSGGLTGCAPAWVIPCVFGPSLPLRLIDITIRGGSLVVAGANINPAITAACRPSDHTIIFFSPSWLRERETMMSVTVSVMSIVNHES